MTRNALIRRYERLDRAITGWMARSGLTLLRISLGVVFFWFGVLKYIPGASPAEALAVDAIGVLSFGLMDPRLFLFILATWECAIGVGLMVGRALRSTLLLLFLQFPGTVMPLLLFPDVTFKDFPFVLTIEGQYIVKNLIIISAGFVIGATVRGGRLTDGSAEVDVGRRRRRGGSPEGGGRCEPAGAGGGSDEPGEG